MQGPGYEHAIVRKVPDSFDSCIKASAQLTIDVRLARMQHDAYRKILESLGLEVTALEADDRYPDCCFVEDAAIVAGERAILLPLGAPSRVGEEIAVGKLLARYKTVHRMASPEIDSPARMDGGDVLAVGKKLFVGLSRRTNRNAVAKLKEMLAADGYEVVAVPLRGVLHLKSACSHLGNGCVLICRGYFDENIFSAYQRIIVHPDDAYSANCLAVNGRVIVSKGFPRTRDGIEAAGFETIELDMSEFRKGGGSLTCLSIVF
jgi:dimethylargininase